jgi:hypothetical protein
MLRNSTRALLVLCSILFVGCESSQQRTADTYLAEILTVRIDGDSIVLEDGEHRAPAAPGSASMNITKIHHPIVEGDLDGDDNPDAIAVLTRSTGGTGTFYYVCAIPDYEHNRLSTEAIFVGDRTSIESITVRSNTISLKYVDRDLDTSFAQEPTVEKIMHLHLEGGQLVQASDSVE